MSERVAAVVVHYGEPEQTIACVRSLAGTGARPIVVANGPSESTAALRRGLPDVEILDPGGNLGYAAGNNLGFRRALDSGAAYVLVLNNDVEVTAPSFVDELVDVMDRDPSLGIVGPLVRAPDGSLQPTVETWPSVSRILAYVFPARGRARDLELAAVTQVEAVNGVCMLIRREVLAAIGGFDERYFMYGEEVDLSYRAARKGYATALVPVPSILHHHEPGQVRGPAATAIRVNWVRFCASHRSLLSAAVCAALFVATAALRREARPLLRALRVAAANGEPLVVRLSRAYDEIAVPLLLPVLVVLLAFGSSWIGFVRTIGSGGKFVALAALAIGPALGLVEDVHARRPPAVRPLGVFVLAFVLLAASSAAWSATPAESVKFALGLALLFTGALWAPYRLVRRRGAALVVAALLVGVAAVVLLQVLAVAWSPHGAFQQGFSLSRFRGFLESPNTIGAYVFLVPLGIWLAQRVGGRSRAAIVVLLALLVVEIVVSGTRLAVALAAVLVVLYLLASRLRGRLAVVLGGLVLAAAIAVAVASAAGLSTSERLPRYLRPNTIPTLSGRTEAWLAAAEMIRARPLTGYGIGTESIELLMYRQRAQRIYIACNARYAPTYVGDTCNSDSARAERLADFSGSYVHNSFFGLAIQMGAVVAGAWTLVLLAIALRPPGSPRHEHGRLDAALLGCLVGGLAWAFYSTYLWSPGNVVAAPFWVLVALVLAAHAPSRRAVTR